MNQQTTAAQSPFPPPPDYALNYKTENMTNGAFPPPPVPTVFTVFGEEYNLNDDIIRPLSVQGIRQIYPNKHDWKTEMKKLNSSVMAAFLDLVDILIKSPDNPERMEKLEDIHSIFINMHHLINEYRPLQARDTLRLMQKEQVADTEQSVERLKGYISEGRAALKDDLSLQNIIITPVPRPIDRSGVFLDSDDEQDMPKEATLPPEERTNLVAFRAVDPDSKREKLYNAMRDVQVPANPVDLRTRREVDFIDLSEMNPESFDLPADNVQKTPSPSYGS